MTGGVAFRVERRAEQSAGSDLAEEIERAFHRGPFPGFNAVRAWSGLAVHFYERAEVSTEWTIESAAHLVLIVRHGWGRLRRVDGPSEEEGLLIPGRVLFVAAGTLAAWSGRLPDCLALSVVPDTPRPVPSPAAGGRRIETMPDPFCEQFGATIAAIDEHHPADAAFAAAMRRALLAHLERRPPPGPGSARLNEAKLATVLDFIDARLGEPLSLDSLADIAGVGRFHFARMFKTALGVTPMAYVERTRIDAAKSLLAHGRTSIAEVAALVGFADQSHFTRRFRRHTGTTPAVFTRWKRRTLHGETQFFTPGTTSSIARSNLRCRPR